MKSTKNEKKVMKIAVIGIISAIILIFYGCGLTSKDIIEKYNIYGEVQSTTNKAGVHLDVTKTSLTVSYSNSLLNTNEEYMQSLAIRWFIADAENPDVRLPFKIELMSINSIITQSTIYKHNLIIDDTKTRFFLICFEGIDAIESEEAATPPLFFIVENDKETREILTVAPRLADNIFKANYEKTNFFTYLTVEQIFLVESIGLESLELTNENGVKLYATDFNKWFENVTVKNVIISSSTKLDIYLGMPFLNPNRVHYIPSDNEILLFEFNHNGKVFPIGVGKGTKLIIEKSNTQNNILLLEETAKLSPPPTIEKKDQIIIYKR